MQGEETMEKRVREVFLEDVPYDHLGLELTPNYIASQGDKTHITIIQRERERLSLQRRCDVGPNHSYPLSHTHLDQE